MYWYKFNTEEKPLNNVNIRKALAYAIDRSSIVKNVTQGEQIPAMVAVPPSMKGFKDNTKGYFKDNDVKSAKEFLNKGLKELGVKNASDLPAIKLSYNTDDAHAKIAQAVQEMWKRTWASKLSLITPNGMFTSTSRTARTTKSGVWAGSAISTIRSTS